MTDNIKSSTKYNLLEETVTALEDNGKRSSDVLRVGICAGGFDYIKLWTWEQFANIAKNIWYCRFYDDFAPYLPRWLDRNCPYNNNWIIEDFYEFCQSSQHIINSSLVVIGNNWRLLRFRNGDGEGWKYTSMYNDNSSLSSITEEDILEDVCYDTNFPRIFLVSVSERDPNIPQ